MYTIEGGKKLRIVGDIHGYFGQYCQIVKDAEQSVQVGDFGIGFGDLNWNQKVNEFHEKNPQHKFIRGNHDSPKGCEEAPGWIMDGTITNDIMLVGGAWSIDSINRTEGVNWWREEELSQVELDRIIDTYALVQPRVMITHDCPLVASKQMFIDRNLSLISGGGSIKTRTGQAFDAMFEIHQPELWVFGHWHVSSISGIGKTKFVCLGELDYMDITV